MGSLTPALLSILSSNSFKYSVLGPSSIEKIYLAFKANRDICLSFLRQYVDYGEKVLACYPPSDASPPSSRVDSQHELQERTRRLLSEVAGVSVENIGSIQGLFSYQLTPFDGYNRHKCTVGPRKFKGEYNKALSLERKTTSELRRVITVTGRHLLPDDALPDEIPLEQLRELWENAKDTVRVALATLKDEPAPQMAPTRLRSLKRSVMTLVRFS
jgi:hypothetical protein